MLFMVLKSLSSGGKETGEVGAYLLVPYLAHPILNTCSLACCAIVLLLLHLPFFFLTYPISFEKWILNGYTISWLK